MYRILLDSKNSIWYQPALELYGEAFPPEETFPVEDYEVLIRQDKAFVHVFLDSIENVSRTMAERNLARGTGTDDPQEIAGTLKYADPDSGQVMTGAVIGVKNEKYILLLFLAVNDSIRGMGIGSAILGSLSSMYPEHVISLQIETLRFPAENMDQRVRRERFYLKNGYHHAPMTSDEPGGLFDYMFTNGDMTFQEMDSFTREVMGEYLEKWGVNLVKIDAYMDPEEELARTAHAMAESI